jgi:hypothetical protein
MFQFLGDTVEEVARKLVDIGYPAETAVRVADGTLPMDYASRMQRAMEQGYDMTPMYSGVDAGNNGPITEINKILWASDNPNVANTYGTHPASGTLYKVLTKSPDLSVDALGNNWNAIDGGNLSTNDIVRSANDQQGVIGIKNVRDVGPFSIKLRKVSPDMADDAFNASEVRAVRDPSASRSLLSAAFDPEYTGSNILGGSAGLGILGGLLADYEEEERKRGLLDGL